MRLFTVTTLSMLFVPMVIVSCDSDPLDDMTCPCVHGGSIEGWENGNDTTINKTDTTSGFAITVDDWSHSQQCDIHL